MSSFPIGVVNPMRASGGLAPISLCEVLTAAGDLYLWSEQDLASTSSLLTVGVAPIASITVTRHLGGDGSPDTYALLVTLNAPATIQAGAQVTIAGNSASAFNAAWDVTQTGAVTLTASCTGALYGTSGTGGTCSGVDASASYKGWIVGQPKFNLTGTLQTDTGSVAVQNYSGNTVTRDVATAFSEVEFIGALVYYRLWRADSEAAIFTFMGNVNDVEIDDDQMTLSIEGFGNWSAVTAPAYLIGENCPLYFGSTACGSTSPTPCQNTLGTCTSVQRFAGVIVQWDWANQGSPETQVVQPPPIAGYNPSRAF